MNKTERITSLIEQLYLDLHDAIECKDNTKITALQYIIADLVYEKKKTGKDLMPKQELSVLSQCIKKYSEGINRATGAGKHDTVQTFSEQMAILKKYEPMPVTYEFVFAEIAKICEENNISNVKNFGLVMKKLSPIINNRFDKSEAIELIKRFLTKDEEEYEHVQSPNPGKLQGEK